MCHGLVILLDHQPCQIYKGTDKRHIVAKLTQQEFSVQQNKGKHFPNTPAEGLAVARFTSKIV